MNLFEKIEMFEKLASELTDEVDVSEAIDNTDVSSESNHLERRNSILMRMKKLAALSKRF